MVETFDRPSWLYRMHGRAPAVEQSYRAPRPVSERDLELCRRLIEAYRLAQREAPPAEGMWSHSLFHERQRQLREALERGEPAPVADLLGSMFRADFVIGMARGSMDLRPRRGLSARLARLSALNKLAALAEATGSTRLENPEQGPVAPALQGGLEQLVSAIEQKLGLSLDFPDVGAPYGVVAGGRLIAPDAPDQVYGAARLRDVLAAYAPAATEPPRIVEIGGGYGGMAYWFTRMVDARYVIVDLPIVGVIQGYFLSEALGHDAVALHGESPAAVTIVPGHATGSIETPFDVLVNKDSLPEIPVDVAIGYLEWARSACGGAFYSYNQENGGVFEGTPQNVVCELVERVGGFTRVRRDPSWLRRGYVEEVFLPASADRQRE